MPKIPTRMEIDWLRMQYPAGTRVRLIYLNAPYSFLRRGDLGIITGVDDTGQINVIWERGVVFPLIPGEDKFAKEAGNDRPRDHRHCT